MTEFAYFFFIVILLNLDSDPLGDELILTNYNTNSRPLSIKGEEIHAERDWTLIFRKDQFFNL